MKYMLLTTALILGALPASAEVKVGVSMTSFDGIVANFLVLLALQICQLSQSVGEGCSV